VAKEMKKIEGIAVDHPDFPKWCQLTDPDDGTAQECKKVDLSPIRLLYPSVKRRGVCGTPRARARRA